MKAKMQWQDEFVTESDFEEEVLIACYAARSMVAIVYSAHIILWASPFDVMSELLPAHSKHFFEPDDGGYDKFGMPAWQELEARCIHQIPKSVKCSACEEKSE